MTGWAGWLGHAYLQASRSPDPLTQIGAVLLSPDGRRVRAVGHNHFPPGVDPACWDERELKYPRVVHAEVAATLFCARHGLPTACCTLVCPWAACSHCARVIVEAGITCLVRERGYVEHFNPYWREDVAVGDLILAGAGVEVVEVDPPALDFTLRRNGADWSPA